MSQEIENGEPILIDSAIIATGPGSTFVFQLDPSGNDFSAVFQATGTLTTLSADLQISLDGGTTFNTQLTAAVTAAAPVKIVTPVIAGALYRFNYGTASGSINMRVCAN